MATAQKVRVIEKNEGSKIDFRQKGTRLYFGDDDLVLRCDTRQREYPVHVDICMDEDGNLVTGVGENGYYVAQIDIPGIAYEEREAEADPESAEHTDEGEETAESAEMSAVEMEKRVERVALPLNMEDVTVTLWSIDGLYINN